jgi:hypothetical protein
MAKKTVRKAQMLTTPRQPATEKTALRTAMGISLIAKIAGSTLVGLAATVTAYLYLGLPVVATRGYVEDAIRPITDRIESVNSSGLNGRLEQLAANRQRALAEKFDLDLKTRTIDAKSPTGAAALSVIQGRQRDIDDIVKGLDEQIAATKAELLKSQEARAKK